MSLLLLRRSQNEEFTGRLDGLYGRASEAPGPGPKSPGTTPQQSQEIIGVLTMLLVICAAAVVGRIASRRMSKQNIGGDDLWVLSAITFFIAQAALVYYNQSLVAQARKALSGGQNPHADIFRTIAKTKTATSLLYLFTITAARCSVLFLSRRIFNLRVLWFRIAWWLSLTIVALYWMYFIIANLAACAPHAISATWTDPRICTHQDLSVPAAQSFLNVLIELILWALPIRMIWTLQLNRQQKIAVSGVFALGSIAVFVSLARAITMVRAVTFTTLSGLPFFVILSITEPAVMIICTCLPVMKPIFNALARSVSGRSWLSSSPSRTNDVIVDSRNHTVPLSGLDEEERKLTSKSHPYVWIHTTTSFDESEPR